MKFDTQIQNIALAGAITAGTNSLAGTINLDSKFKRCVGIKVVPIDNGGLTQYDIKIQHPELSERDPVDYRDWNVSSGQNYRATFKPLDISAAGAKVDVWVTNRLSSLTGTLRFQVIYLLSNEE